MIESSQLMKKAFKALNKDLLTIVAYALTAPPDQPLAFLFSLSSCISLALIHILFFATMAMFLFPQSDVCHERGCYE